MSTSAASVPGQPWHSDHEGKNEAHSSGVSWAAVIAGAFVTAALSLILFALCAGIGFSAISPWDDAGASASRIGVGAIICLILVELISSSVGGYLAGRLRTKWVNIHTHEVYFRDTAHGFLVWAVSLVIVAFLPLAIVGGTSRMSSRSTAGTSAMESGPTAYFVDMLLRPSSPSAEQNDASVHREFEIIFAHALRKGDLPSADQTYLAQVVAAKTGVSEPDAEKRVSDTLAEARESADKARKAVAHTLYWTFLALLIGAFCASFAATIGGKQRDRVIVIQ
jgi:hypothetical protein